MVRTGRDLEWAVQDIDSRKTNDNSLGWAIQLTWMARQHRAIKAKVMFSLFILQLEF